MIFLRSQLQNDDLNGGISLSDDRFPASGTDFCFTTIKTADRRVVKMATACLKWLPAVLRDGFVAIQAAKMAVVWRIFAGL